MELQKLTYEELDKSDQELISMAIKAKDFSYSPYSKFRVGSSILTKNGQVFSGCNIENISFSPTVCAERTAIFKAISEGKTEFSKIVVAVDDDNFCTPCGVCRQVMSEFCEPTLTIFLVNGKNEIASTSLENLFPGSFNPNAKIG